MNTEHRTLPPELLLEEYRRLLQNDRVEALPLVISGSSMTPFLVHGRDTVFLARLTRPARRGDMLLYRRHTGAYILHRVYRVQPDGALTVVGDAQTELEPHIAPEQVIAVVTAADRKGRRQQPGCFWWNFFAGPWLTLLPLRRPLMRAYAALTRR